MTVREQVLEEIRRRGPIPFSRYMELCLYSPRGFYARQKEQFGKAGDFYTSSDVHAVFGRLLARQFEEMWRVLDKPQRLDIVEFGPGRGLFAQDLLDWSAKKFPDFAATVRYTLVESSPIFRERLQQRFAGRIAAGSLAVCAGLEDLAGSSQTFAGVGPGASPGRSVDSPASLLARAPRPRASFADAILFANEFFDAFPVEIVAPAGQLHLAEEAGDFREIFLPPSPEVLEYLDRYSVHPEEGERVEAPLAALAYARDLAAFAERGFCVFIDYGYTRDEQLAGRHRDTLKAFRQHTMSANPYEAPGEQDLTADVNFSALSAAMRGWSELALLTQAQFLMGIGESTQFADAFEDTRLPQERAKVMLQLKHLVTPAGMGEAFHVLVLEKGIEVESARRISGLTFAR